MIDLLSQTDFTDEQMFSVAPFRGLVELSPRFSPRPQISHVVFDFDGTLSWLRNGWPDVVIPDYRDAPAPLRCIFGE